MKIYKIVMITLSALLFSSQMAFSHPQESDSILNIPAKSKIKFQKDMNILPSTSSYHLGKNSSYKDGNQKNAYCYIVFPPSMNDRVIKAGSEFEFSTTFDSSIYDELWSTIKSFHSVKLKNSDSKIDLKCDSSITSSSAATKGSINPYESIDISIFRKILNENGITLEIAKPINFSSTSNTNENLLKPPPGVTVGNINSNFDGSFTIRNVSVLYNNYSTLVHISSADVICRLLGLELAVVTPAAHDRMDSLFWGQDIVKLNLNGTIHSIDKLRPKNHIGTLTCRPKKH